MSNQKSFILSCAALSLSIITVALFFIKVTPNSVIDSGTFISICAAFIGISVTLLIGYQIYNAFEIKNKLSEIGNLKSELEAMKSKTEKLQNELYEAIAILQSRDPMLKQTYSPEAFLHFISAIPYTLSLPEKRDEYKWMLNELRQNMINILPQSFGNGGQEVYQRGVSNIRELYKESDEKIRNHKNYYLIKDRYEELMKKFEKRLDIISEMKDPSLLYLDMVRGEEPDRKNNKQ